MKPATHDLEVNVNASANGPSLPPSHKTGDVEGQDCQYRAFKVDDGAIRHFYVDWLLFVLGFQFLIPFYVGACLPFCRRRKFRDSWQKTAWVLNVVMSVVYTLLWIIVVASLGSATARANAAYRRYYGSG